MQSPDDSSDENVNCSATNSPRQTRHGSNIHPRVNAIKELVTLQNAFAADMHHLRNALENAHSPFVTEEDRENVISSLPQLSRITHELSRCWYTELSRLGKQQLWEANIATTFFPFKDKISEALCQYATNYEANICTEKSHVRLFLESALKELQKIRPNTIILESELIKPVQWLFRYQKLFENILKYTPPSHPDYKASVELIDHFNELTRHVNEKKRWNELRIQAFETPKVKRKLHNRFFDLLKVTANFPIDYQFERERESLIDLRERCEKVHTWVKEYFHMIISYLRAEREFLTSIQNACDTSGHLHITHSSGLCPRQTLSQINLYQQTKPYIAMVQSTISHMTTEIMPTLDTKVLDRLSDLLIYLEDPEKLIEIYRKSKWELNNIVSLLEQNKDHNQGTTALTEKKNTLKCTVDTLHTGLMDQIPKLRAMGERLLYSALIYALSLNRDLSRHLASLMVEQSRNMRTTLPFEKFPSFMNFVEDVVARVNKQPHSSNSSIRRVHSASHKNIISLGFDQVNGRTSGRQRHATTTQLDVPRSTLDHLVPLSVKVQHSSSYSDSTDLVGLTAYSSTTNHLSVTCSKSLSGAATNTSSVHSSPVLRTAIARSSQSRKIAKPNVATRPIHEKPTHRASYSFEKQNDDQVNMQAGQYITVLRPCDSIGNKQWCLVEVLPNRQQGYVPANRLSPLDQ